MDALELAGVKNLERKMNTLQALVWDTIAEPIWQQKNKLQHSAENKYTKRDGEQLDTKMLWILEHKQELLACGNHFLAKMCKTEFRNTKRKSKKKWLHNLEIAQRRHAIERYHHKKGQRVITSYFKRREQARVEKGGKGPPLI